MQVCYVALWCVQLCSYVVKNGHFDGFSCTVRLESRHYQLCFTLLCFEAEVSCSTLKYKYKFKLSKSSFSLPYCKLMGAEI